MTKKAIVINKHDNVATSITDIEAGGAQILLFTTGRGSPVGTPITPVIKITGNPFIFEKMKDNMDINAGTIIKGKESIECVGQHIFNEILEVASGKQTKSEVLGHKEFAIFRERGHAY